MKTTNSEITNYKFIITLITLILKIIFIIVMIIGIWTLSSKAQSSYTLSDCGKWVKDKVTITSWETLDTLNYKSFESKDYINSLWKEDPSKEVYAVYCPCGCGWETKRIQYRANRQGIRQVRYEITSYKYIPKPLTKYDSIINFIKNK